MNQKFNLGNCVLISKLTVLFICAAFVKTKAQSKVNNKYGLKIIADMAVFKSEIARDPTKEMIDLKRFIPGILLDLRYQTDSNFMHEKLYPPVKTTFLRKPAAEGLKRAMEMLQKKDLTLKIFDAYRPYSVTEQMWEKVHDSRYAADPATGSGHNRGTAVDLTLADIHTGRELPMGTGFDNFTDSAHADFTNLPENILANRRLLKSVMEASGFRQLSTEWWHFYLPDSKDFELLDLSFTRLRRLYRK